MQQHGTGGGQKRSDLRTGSVLIFMEQIRRSQRKPGCLSVRINAANPVMGKEGRKGRVSSCRSGMRKHVEIPRSNRQMNEKQPAIKFCDGSLETAVQL